MVETKSIIFRSGPHPNRGLCHKKHHLKACSFTKSNSEQHLLCYNSLTKEVLGAETMSPQKSVSTCHKDKIEIKELQNGRVMTIFSSIERKKGKENYHLLVFFFCFFRIDICCKPQLSLLV